MTDSIPPKARTALTVILWGAPIVFSAGGWFVSTSESRAAQHATSAQLEEHVRAPAHPEALHRIQAIETQLAQRAETDRSLAAQLNRIDVNLALVCQATKGAQCVR